MAQGTVRDRKRVHNTKFRSYFSLSGKQFISHERAQKVDLTFALTVQEIKTLPYKNTQETY
jgi:hypothetical protein